MFKRTYLAFLLIFSVWLVFSGDVSIAAKPIKIIESKGVAKSRLTHKHETAKKNISLRPVKSGVDTQYEGQRVYYHYFGKKKNGQYPLEVYSKKNKKIYMYVVNDTQFQTAKKVKIGTTEKQLKKIYGKKLKLSRGDIYNKYTLGKKTGTDFYVKNSNHKVKQIIVRKY